MPQQETVDVAKAQVRAYNDKNWGAVTETLTENVVYDEVGTNRKIVGVTQVIETWKGWATAFPDSMATFDAEYSAGDIVILELTWRGTHRGTLQTPAGRISATGKPIEIRACQIVDVRNGQVQAVRHYFDMATLFTQLGASPAAM